MVRRTKRMIEQQANLEENNLGFERLLGITNELRQKLEARFELHPNPCTQDLQSYTARVGEAQGSLKTFSGPEINLLVHGWMRDPKSGFSTMRLSIWLGSHIQVPHLAFEFGTFPYILFYMDYIPRRDLFTDLEYLDFYYEPVNQTYLKFQTDSRFQAFNSKMLYMRQVQSRTSLCYTCSVADETLNIVRNTACDMMERWLKWVDEAEPVAESERATLSQRDLFVRRAIAERDEDSKKAEQIFGAELTSKLVRALWSNNDAD